MEDTSQRLGATWESSLRPLFPPQSPFLLTLPPKEDPGHSPDLDLPWAALEAIVRDWGFMGSPGAG